MRFRLGLTGSIGMGKSATALLFAEQGCAVWDADAAVHRLYDAGGAAVEPIATEFPQVVSGGAVSRPLLRAFLDETPGALERIEAIVHPLVLRDRQEFARRHSDSIGVFDIPLLFESGGERDMDAVACVSVDEATQRARVLERGTMSEAQFARILDRQMPIAQKRAMADYVIETDTVETARAQVRDVLQDIERRLKDA